MPVTTTTTWTASSLRFAHSANFLLLHADVSRRARLGTLRHACLGTARREHEKPVGERVRDLEGLWNVRRTGGLLPPLVGVRKRILGARGETAIGPLPGFPFTVDGLRLRYRSPLRGFVDELEPAADGFRGRATFCGRQFGTFELRRKGS
jgi:hypothetical protein